jgi:hypothetical protein
MKSRETSAVEGLQNIFHALYTIYVSKRKITKKKRESSTKFALELNDFIINQGINLTAHEAQQYMNILVRILNIKEKIFRFHPKHV